MTDHSPAVITYRIEKFRAAAVGILETAGSTFLLLIAVRAFEAGATEKALIAAGGNIGLLITPLTVVIVERLRWPASRGAAALALLGAVAFVLPALAPVLPLYVLGSVIGMTCANGMIPLVTQIYQDNYASDERGRFYSRATIIRVAAAALFAEGAGRLLTENIALFRWLLVVFGVCFAFSAFWLARIPSRPLADLGSRNPLRGLKYVRDDRLFRNTLIVWMLMGFANLMMMPLRVEYLANPRYGLSLNAQSIALMTSIIPSLVRLVLSPVWGWLFDRMNFFVLRITVNMAFAIGIVAFFTGSSLPGLIAGSLVFGVAFSGGDVAWSLWVTKFAPPSRVADYMSVHTFFTGLRGVVAPLLAFQLVSTLPIEALGLICFAMITAASALLLPEVRHGNRTADTPAPAGSLRR
ncbi:MAG: MFS transporter [Anaerolineae bacterium]|nr:MFS transporter [Thermoflexales bacterium]MDW8407150.1 MFS transporter [Anaerolineae bacterium]